MQSAALKQTRRHKVPGSRTTFLRTRPAPAERSRWQTRRVNRFTAVADVVKHLQRQQAP